MSFYLIFLILTKSQCVWRILLRNKNTTAKYFIAGSIGNATLFATRMPLNCICWAPCKIKRSCATPPNERPLLDIKQKNHGLFLRGLRMRIV